MASKIKNIESLINVFGEEDTVHILKKLEESKINITNRSGLFITNVSNLILNYSDYLHNGDRSKLENKTMDEIKKEYDDWEREQKSKYSTFDKPKDKKILYDYRKNGIGRYWIDLESNRDPEMIFNMDNCGRVGINQRIIILREQKESGENLMQVAISISKGHYIHQIKGRREGKPTAFYNEIFDFLLRYEPIVGFKRVFKPEDDFKVFDLNNEDREKLKLVKPHLFGDII
jgi:hypothetical protein